MYFIYEKFYKFMSCPKAKTVYFYCNDYWKISSRILSLLTPKTIQTINLLCGQNNKLLNFEVSGTYKLLLRFKER